MYGRPGPRKSWHVHGGRVALFAAFALFLPIGTSAQNGVWNAQEILASKDPAVQQFLERDLEMSLIRAEGAGG